MAYSTERLLLREWRAEDHAPFAALNADPQVMLYLNGPLNRRQSDVVAERIKAHFAEHGFGVWAIELPGLADFIGFCGLAKPRFTAHFTPCVEIGWRLARSYWGNGYATEAARRALKAGFEDFALTGIFSFTVPENRRSRAVMERLGMRSDPADDFDHPFVPKGDPLCRHKLYRLTAEDYRASKLQSRAGSDLQ